MRPHLKSLSFATATLFSLMAPLFLSAHLSLPAVAQAAPNRKAEAERLLHAGRQLIEKGEFKAALEKLKQAFQVYQQTQDRNGEAATLNEFGRAYEGLSDYAKMGEAYQTALKLARGVGNRNEEVHALNGVGDIDYYQSEYPSFITLSR
jgi:tetratricopeptide (TPR) repeat protein